MGTFDFIDVSELALVSQTIQKAWEFLESREELNQGQLKFCFAGMSWDDDESQWIVKFAEDSVGDTFSVAIAQIKPEIKIAGYAFGE